MNNLQVVEQKLVDFNGAEIMGVKTDDGTIRVGVSWICDGIGLTRDQTKNERRKIQEDLVLQKGGAKFDPPYKRWHAGEEFAQLNFQLGTYLDKNNQARPKFNFKSCIDFVRLILLQ